MLGDCGVVHRRKTALATTWFATMAAVPGTRASQRDAVVRRAWFGCRQGSWKRGFIVLHPRGDIINESATRSTVAEVARPPCAVSLVRQRERGGVNGRCGEAPAHCVFVVASARRPACGPSMVVPLCQMMYDVATALRRQVPHGGGLLGAVLSVPLVSLSTWGHDSMATSEDEKGWLPQRLRSFSALCFVRVDVPIRPD